MSVCMAWDEWAVLEVRATPPQYHPSRGGDGRRPLIFSVALGGQCVCARANSSKSQATQAPPIYIHASMRSLSCLRMPQECGCRAL